MTSVCSTGKHYFDVFRAKMYIFNKNNTFNLVLIQQREQRSDESKRIQIVILNA